MDELSQLRGANSDLADRLRLRQEEIDSLRDLMNGSTEELISLQVRLRESRESVNTVTAELLPLRHEVEQVKIQRDLMSQRNDSLEETLSTTRRELSTAQLAHNDAALTSASQLRTSKSELAMVTARANELRDNLNLQNERYEDCLQSLQEKELMIVQRDAEAEKEIDRYREKTAAVQREYEEVLLVADKLRQELALAQEDRDVALNKARESQVAADEAQARATAAASERDAHANQIENLPFKGRQTDEMLLRPAELFAAFEAAQAQLAVERGARRQAEMYLSRILAL